MPKDSIYHNLDDMKLLACHQAKEHNCNYNVILMNPKDGKFDISNGSTYEMVADSYFNKERPNCILLHKTDDLLFFETGEQRAIDYWDLRLKMDKTMFHTDMGVLDPSLMADMCAVNFQIATKDGFSEKEIKLLEWATQYKEKLRRQKIDDDVLESIKNMKPISQLTSRTLEDLPKVFNFKQPKIRVNTIINKKFPSSRQQRRRY